MHVCGIGSVYRFPLRAENGFSFGGKRRIHQLLKNMKEGNKMKKAIALILALLMIAALAGCGAKTQEPAPTETPKATEAPAPTATEAPVQHYPVTISTYNYAKEPVEVTFNECP